ncbi:tetratricopeptide repeat protein [Streptomyces cinnabarinus]|uniref:Tetratricopeptide repeat protein n=1 Tax=Streptomyces cinnabarinus TaxID=67287 RepID=A0ABY7KPU4_9ACTN|nr:tetratricopeptide repeat protein [Streptomyces cinnabarinus]WAZ26594.1 tetratricopeptide repeat protein [Streptomyces cinnabarinus]
MDQTQLARQSGLGRTTVSKALSPAGDVPSVDTVTALARTLRLPTGELLRLQRTAAEESGAVSLPAPGPGPGPGKPIGRWEPHELEVHPAGSGHTLAGRGRVQTLPGYVPRRHDQALAGAVTAAAAGRSGIVVLVGTSSTGKTRACWEAVQPLASQGWRLWHPFHPTRAEAALEELHQVRARTVVWLNEAQHYLGDPAVGERIAATVHQLLGDEERGPVLVLGTLWPEYAHQYGALPTPGGPDPHSRVRELLAGRILTVPDTFDTTALAAAAALAENGDGLLADALTRARNHGRVAQDLAGAPELLRRYEQATPPARALLEAAMDARRLGVGLHLPHAFLTHAASGYLSEHDYDQLTDHWAEQAYAELDQPVHGKQAPLRKATPRPRQHLPAPTTATSAHITAALSAGPVFRLADYLEQHGRTARRHLCPPSSFWHAAHTHLTHPNDLRHLTQAAYRRYRLQWAHHLRHRAAEHGDTDALARLAVVREEAGDREGAEALARQATDHGDTDALRRLAMMRAQAGDWEGAEALAGQAAEHGDTGPLCHLAEMRESADDREAAETLYQQAADHGSISALWHLADMREKTDDREAAETLYRQAADRGSISALFSLALLREDDGDRAAAGSLYQQAADQGSISALFHVAVLREEAGDREGAEAAARRAASNGDTDALYQLAEMREEAGDRKGAEALAWQAVDHGSAVALFHLGEMRDEAGDSESANDLYRRAADHGSTSALFHMAVLREETGDREGSEALAWQAAGNGTTTALYRLAEMREQAQDREGAEALYRQAAEHGDTDALYRLAEWRERAGDREGAATLARQAADNGGVLYRFSRHGRLLKRLWPHGLDPDGTPTPPWQ